MKTLALTLFASLLLAGDATRAPAETVPAPEPAPAAAADDVDPDPVAVPVPPPEVRETSAPVPADVTASVRPAKGGGWSVRLSRRGQLVAVRHGSVRAAAAGEASLVLAAGDAEPVIWETTRLDTLATVRGTIHVEGLEAGGKPLARLRLAEAPVPAGREARRLHTCAAHEDGAGGFTVLCRVRARPGAASVTGDDDKADVWVVPADATGASVARLDLPASSAGVAARVLGYSAGVDGVVVRAEASRVAGEPRPVLSLLSAERAQPQIPRAAIRYTCCRYPLFSRDLD